MRAAVEILYYPFVLAALVYTLYKIKFNLLNLFIVLIFWAGLFNYLGTSVSNIYKISVVILALVLFGKKVLIIRNKHDYVINIFFLVFSLSFWISYLIQGGGIITILSQYGYKYGLVFLLYHGLKDVQYNPVKREKMKNIILFILMIQVILSVIKIFIFGFNYEPDVGSMAYGGAGLAVVIPIVGLILFWTVNQGHFSSKEWLFLFSFFLISVASGKRAPVILFPLFILLLLLYTHGKIAVIRGVKYIPVVFLLVYIGVKITPSLNPEGKFWGSFDLSHVIDYTLRYNFGSSEIEKINSQEYESAGRGGSFLLLFQPGEVGLNSSKDLLFGRGLYDVAVKEHGKFMGGEAYGINHQSLVGEHVKILYTLGYAGLIFMSLFSIAIIQSSRDRFLAAIIMLFYLWEFFFYYNQVVFSNASAIIVVFTCFYSNSLAINRYAETEAENRTSLNYSYNSI